MSWNWAYISKLLVFASDDVNLHFNLLNCVCPVETIFIVSILNSYYYYYFDIIIISTKEISILLNIEIIRSLIENIIKIIESSYIRWIEKSMNEKLSQKSIFWTNYGRNETSLNQKRKEMKIKPQKIEKHIKLQNIEEIEYRKYQKTKDEG